MSNKRATSYTEPTTHAPVVLNPAAIQAPEAEEALIGCILVNPQAYFEALAVVDTEEVFSQMRYRYIWQAMQAIHHRGDYIDHLTVATELDQRNALADVGGRAELIKIVNNTPTSMHAPVYAQLIHRVYVRRKLLDASKRIEAIINDESLTVDEVIAQSNASILQAGDVRNARYTDDFATVIDETNAELDDLEAGRIEHTGYKTGFHMLDGITDGLKPGRFYIVAGRPGQGKSALCLSMAHKLARQNVRVLYINIEMMQAELANRLTSIEILSEHNQFVSFQQQTSRAWLQNPQNADKKALIRKAREYLRTLPIKIPMLANYKPSDVEAAIARYMAKGECDVVIIDGIYLMSSDIRNASDIQRFEDIATSLKKMSLKYRIPIVATHQLSRGVEHRADHRPFMSDLYGSSTLENSADLIAFCYREAYYDPTADERRMELIVAKHRNGDVGTIDLVFERGIVADGRLVTYSLGGEGQIVDEPPF